MGPGQEAEGAVSIHLTNGWMQQDASLTVSKKGLAIAEALLSRCCTPSFCPRICTSVHYCSSVLCLLFALRLRPPSFLFRLAGARCTAMPLTYDVVNAIVPYHTLEQAYPFPALTYPHVISLLDVSIGVSQLWLGDPSCGLMPLFRNDNHGITTLAQQILDRDVPLQANLEHDMAQKPATMPFGKRAGNLFADGWGPKGRSHSSKPLIKVEEEQYSACVAFTNESELQLMFQGLAEREAFEYIADVATRMLEGSGDLSSVDLRLFVGWRDFKKTNITAYQRAKVSSAVSRFSWITRADMFSAQTLLAARDYEVVCTFRLSSTATRSPGKESAVSSTTDLSLRVCGPAPSSGSFWRMSDVRLQSARSLKLSFFEATASRISPTSRPDK